MPKPIAPKAKEAYKNSTISTINWLDPSYSVYARNLAYPHGIAREISEIDANDSDFFRPISRTIRRELSFLQFSCSSKPSASDTY